MSAFLHAFQKLQEKKNQVPLNVYTLGGFEAVEQNRRIDNKAWGRDRTLQLFQFFVTFRNRKSMHKEQIIDRLWENAGRDDGDSNFKVALHGINKVLEPNRAPRTDPTYILRQGVSYHLNTSLAWIDAQAAEDYIALGNEAYREEPSIAKQSYRSAIELHRGVYLPDRAFEDWSSEERERLQVLIMGGLLSLAELELDGHPMETIRLTQQALAIDNTWEDAYQLQMKAYIRRGNRPAAIRTYRKCVALLDKEYGLDPLPDTQAIYDNISLKVS